MRKRKYDARISSVIKLYNRCEQMKVLPRAGGMYDQSEKMMQIFDTIRSEHANYTRAKMEASERSSRARRQLNERNHG